MTRNLPRRGARRHVVVAAAAVVLAATACSDTPNDGESNAASPPPDTTTPITATSAAATTAPATTGIDDTTTAGRPPLPTDPPSGEAVDRSADELPDGFEPVAWSDVPARPALAGPLAVNRLITNAEVHGEEQLRAAEDVAPGLDGHLYTGTEDGGIWRVVVDGPEVRRIERVATVDGRPLGIDSYSEDVIVVAVAQQGLVAVDTQRGESWVLTDRLEGNSIFFPDGVAVTGDGTIYFTEASTRYYPGFPLDFLDGRPSGRLLRYEPTTGRTDVVVDRLYFANGVVVDPDERYALVAESFRFRITRVWLEGDRSGTTEQFGPDLVNGADNLRLDEAGRVWVGGSALRSDLVDAVLVSGELRARLATTPPAQIADAQQPYGFVQVLSPDGEPIFSFHDPTGRFTDVSGALSHHGHVTFATLRDRGIARIPLPHALRG